ncbi:spore gernimation protein GerPD [Fictibacillus macauensis]|uniref:spore gernimation protein GerPD n=1 Tax=Fictibacillus macauensis TaxID=245160 RepID=UPI0003160E22|nr:spore gernimation protein GerPD [Fictibacillus macauensis]
MKYEVINHETKVHNILILGVSISALVLIGDTNYITLSSIFDTPPESLVVGTVLVPM